jgi:thiamine biosynthesis lipoprotein
MISVVDRFSPTKGSVNTGPFLFACTVNCLLNKTRLVAFMLLVLALYGCGERGHQPHGFAGTTMGTTYHVTLIDMPGVLHADDIEQGVQQILDDVNAKMSTYLPDSELMLFNKSAPGDWFPVSAQTVAVVDLAQTISEQSNGYFDTTIGPLVNLWGFGPGADYLDIVVPDQDQIQQLLDQLGYQAVSVRRQPPALRKAKPVSLDLSAIAKGYAVDLVAEYLDSQAIVNYLVEVGGELRARGINKQGLPWKVGVETPVSTRTAPQLAIRVSDRAIATSGDYRNYYEIEGQRFSHTIDPHTGKPITHNLASVTVVADTAAEADGWATALDVMGPVTGFELANSRGMAAYFIIRQDGEFVGKSTDAFQAYMR